MNSGYSGILMDETESGSGEWLRCDEREDALNALEHCAATTLTLASTPLNWKWCLITIHNALQGVLVSTLSGSANVGALDDRSYQKVLDRLEAGRSDPNLPWPRERLADLPTLYDRAKKAEWMRAFGGRPIETTHDQDGDVALLHSLRNSFMHFKPKGWSIQKEGLPRIVLRATGLIETLLFTHPANTFRFDEAQKERAGAAIGCIRGVLGSASG